MARGGFDYSEFTDLADRVREMEKESVLFISRFLLQMGLRVITAAKKRTPTDTGDLINSWQMGDATVTTEVRPLKSGKNKGKNRSFILHDKSTGSTLNSVTRQGDCFMINISNPKMYASFVEYGHWQEVGRFVPGRWEPGAEKDRFVYEQGAKSGMVLKNPWVEGHFMLTVSIQEIERQMPKRLERAWAQYAAGKLKG